jgi:hypothetical protein
MKEDIENMIIQYSSMPISFLICGSIAPEIRMPIETAISKAYKKLSPEIRTSVEMVISGLYENLKIGIEQMGRFLYKENYRS